MAWKLVKHRGNFI